MDFPIIDLIDEDQATDWLLKHFHPEGLHCPHCSADVKEARHFGKTRTSQLQMYRCLWCDGVYNLYSGTVFQQTHFTVSQAVLLLRGICQGVSRSQLSRELDVSRQTVMSIRRVIQANAELMQPGSALPDAVVETDEMFQNAGEKGEPHKDPAAPRVSVATNVKATALTPTTVPLSLAHWGVRVAVRVAHHTDKATLTDHVHQFTECDAIVYTDAWRGYNSLDRAHEVVCHGDGEWARDADADGICEVHTNTIEGIWTTLRNFLRPFRGVHKKYLAGYIAICEFAINLKTITTLFISKLVQTYKCIQS